MAQMLTDRGTSTAPTGVITVADLLSRYAPDPTVGPEPATTPVSVGSLLRREGHATHAAGRPAPARSDRRSDHYDDEPETAVPARRGPALRRSAVAAGVLLAAGTVFGATVVNTTSTPAGDVPRPVGGYPGQGILDPQQPVPDGAVPIVVDNTAQSDTLDPGAGAPTSWMSTAFPDAPETGGGSGTGPTGSALPPPAGPDAPPAAFAPLVADPDDDGSDEAAGGGEQDNGSGQDDQSGGDDDQGAGDDGSGGDRDDSGSQREQGGDGIVGGTVERLGGALPTPLGEPVQALGRTFSGLL